MRCFMNKIKNYVLNHKKKCSIIAFNYSDNCGIRDYFFPNA